MKDYLIDMQERLQEAILKKDETSNSRESLVREIERIKRSFEKNLKSEHFVFAEMDLSSLRKLEAKYERLHGGKKMKFKRVLKILRSSTGLSQREFAKKNKYK